MSTHELKHYIDWLSRQSYPALFDGEVERRLENVRAVFGERKTEEVMEIKNIRRSEMDIIITMAYTALMTFVMTKVVEHTPKDHKR